MMRPCWKQLCFCHNILICRKNGRRELLTGGAKEYNEAKSVTETGAEEKTAGKGMEL